MSPSTSFSPPHAAKRILAVCIGGLGDTILFSPVLKALRSRYPKAHIELLLASPLARMAFAPAKEIDRILVTNTDHRFLPAKAVALLPYSLRSRLSGGFEVGVFATGLNPKFVTLLRTLVGIRTVFSAPKPPEYDTDLSCNVALARCFDNTVRMHDVFFPVTEEALEEAQGELERHDIQDTSKMLAVYPSRELPHRPRWELWKIAKVIELLKSRGLIGKVVLVGSEEEGVEWQSVDNMGIIDVNLAGKLSIQATGALFSQCSLALGNDGGIIHIAGAVACPLVVVTTNVPLSYRPAGMKTTVINSRVQSRPWSKKNRFKPDEAARIKEAIRVEQVFQACLDTLEA